MAYCQDVVVKNSINFCLLCKMNLSERDRSLEDHIKGEYHKDQVVRRIMIKNNIVFVEESKEYQLYCRICCQKRTFGRMITDHIYTTGHQEKIDKISEIIANDGGYITLPESIDDFAEKAYCVICDTYSDFTLESIEFHIKSSEHRKMRAIVVQPYNAIFSVDGTNDELYCKLCKVFIKNYIETIFHHVDQDKKHVPELKKILLLIKDQVISIENYLTNPKEDKAVCNRCRTGVTCNPLGLFTHVNGKKHKEMPCVSSS